MLTYLLVNLCTFGVTFLLSFHPGLAFYKKWPAAWPAIGLSAIFFIAWDIYFTGLGVWGFNKEFITGIGVFDLPIEEYMFFICVPYATLFSYHCICQYVRNFQMEKASRMFIMIVSLGLLLTGLMNSGKLYTSFISIVAGLLLLLQLFVIRNMKMSIYLGTLAFLMIPFTITNGILTGSWFGMPVFWYNDQTILSVRLLTIPVEDVIYTMLLLLVNATLYEFFPVRSKDTVHAKN